MHVSLFLVLIKLTLRVGRSRLRLLRAHVSPRTRYLKTTRHSQGATNARHDMPQRAICRQTVSAEYRGCCIATRRPTICLDLIAPNLGPAGPAATEWRPTRPHAQSQRLPGACLPRFGRWPGGNPSMQSHGPLLVGMRPVGLGQAMPRASIADTHGPLKQSELGHHAGKTTRAASERTRLE